MADLRGGRAGHLRFYRRKYDAAKVLAGFAATARDETDLDWIDGYFPWTPC